MKIPFRNEGEIKTFTRKSRDFCHQVAYPGRMAKESFPNRKDTTVEKSLESRKASRIAKEQKSDNKNFNWTLIFSLLFWGHTL